MIASLDIETSCGVVGCPGYKKGGADQGDQEGKCKHALHHKLNKIDIIGVYDGKTYINFGSDIVSFDKWTADNDAYFVCHNGKFDIKTLMSKGSNIQLHRYRGDTQCLGSCIFRRVGEGYLKKYNDKRAELNAQLPKGSAKHRVGSPLSLKTMAPYYLGVPPFWETPDDHNNANYNELDCRYTFDLHAKLVQEAEQDGTLRTYEEYIMPWQHLLLEAEHEGVLIDEKLLHQLYAETLHDLAQAEAEVHKAVQPAFDSYREALILQYTAESKEKCDAFIAKRIKDESKIAGIRDRYDASLRKRIEAIPDKFNLNSPVQMLKILTWAGIDTVVDKKNLDTGLWEEGEAGNKYVLIRAKVRDKIEIAEVLLKYREKETEARYLKQYIDATVNGRIYCNFSLVGTRTGRLSSSGPNLQNVKGTLRSPFIIADPLRYKIYTVDSSQIEPRLIAYLTGDKQMVKLFADGRDYHNFATKKFFPRETEGVLESDIKKEHSVLRKTAKTGDLSIIYGTGEQTFETMLLLREQMILEPGRAGKMVDSFRNGMQDVLMWKKRLEDQYRNGTKIKNKFGYPVIANGNKVQMTLFNTFIQGQASQMIFHSSLMARRDALKKGIDMKPLIWVHDEVVWRIPIDIPDEVAVKHIDHYMKAYDLKTPNGNVPLDVEGHVADRWQK